MQSEMIKLKMLENLVRVQDRAEKRINVLDYAYMNEDAHSYFLQQILQYERQGHQVFLKSFLKRILDEENIEDEKFDVAAQVQILDGRRRLDLRLESTNLLVVIENKVKLAQDGDRQMDDYWKYVIDRHLTNDWDEGNAYGEGKFYSVRNNKKPVYLVQKGDRTFYVDMNEGYIVRTEYSSEHSNSDYFDEFKNMPVRLGNMLKDKEGRTITDFVEFIKKAQEFAKKKYGEKTLPNGIKTWVQKGDGYNRVTFRDWFNKTTKHLFDANDKEYVDLVND